MKTRIFLLILILSIINLCGLCQKHRYDKTVSIGGFRTSQFYTGEFNPLMVSSEKYSIKSLVVKASQGTLENIDKVQNGFFGLTNLKIGKVTISVFRQCDTGLQILNKHSFKVINRTLTIEQKNTLKLTSKPTISIGGFTDSIPFDVLRNATKIDIDSTLRLKYAVLRLYKRNLKPDTDIILEGGESVLYSNDFDESLKRALKTIGSNSSIGIQLYNIKVIDSLGKVYALESVSFKVID